MWLYGNVGCPPPDCKAFGRAGGGPQFRKRGDVPSNRVIAKDAMRRHGASCHADFLWTSPSTTSNSASTTSSPPAA